MKHAEAVHPDRAVRPADPLRLRQDLRPLHRRQQVAAGKLQDRRVDLVGRPAPRHPGHLERHGLQQPAVARGALEPERRVVLLELHVHVALGPVVADVVLELGVVADVHDRAVAQVAERGAEGVADPPRHRIARQQLKVVRRRVPGVAVVARLDDVDRILGGHVLAAVPGARVEQDQPAVQLQEAGKVDDLARVLDPGVDALDTHRNRPSVPSIGRLRDHSPASFTASA
ncbi:MAG: hypothetical protein OXQ31_07395 [Spirochaetaceae bacterium]|nr:hypothetical protein [Spirochaetaceae bacterium]